jgi:hypothetical protein
MKVVKCLFSTCFFLILLITYVQDPIAIASLAEVEQL